MLEIGDEIIVGDQARLIASIIDDGELTVDIPFDPALSLADYQYSSPQIVINANGNVGIGTISPNYLIDAYQGTGDGPGIARLKG